MNKDRGNMIKRIVIIVLCLALIAVSFSGCGDKQPSAETSYSDSDGFGTEVQM